MGRDLLQGRALLLRLRPPEGQGGRPRWRGGRAPGAPRQGRELHRAGAARGVLRGRVPDAPRGALLVHARRDDRRHHAAAPPGGRVGGPPRGAPAHQHHPAPLPGHPDEGGAVPARREAEALELPPLVLHHHGGPDRGHALHHRAGRVRGHQGGRRPRGRPHPDEEGLDVRRAGGGLRHAAGRHGARRHRRRGRVAEPRGPPVDGGAGEGAQDAVHRAGGDLPRPHPPAGEPPDSAEDAPGREAGERRVPAREEDRGIPQVHRPLAHHRARNCGDGRLRRPAVRAGRRELLRHGDAARRRPLRLHGHGGPRGGGHPVDHPPGHPRHRRHGRGADPEDDHEGRPAVPLPDGHPVAEGQAQELLQGAVQPRRRRRVQGGGHGLHQGRPLRRHLRPREGPAGGARRGRGAGGQHARPGQMLRGGRCRGNAHRPVHHRSSHELHPAPGAHLRPRHSLTASGACSRN
mmetsp:Transcript_122596/g.347593  ORF Transcript_122596/g.347593 Transcript_122596/m.347593 type:complete len:462 (-) Transcript_122596:73-1458(-)